MSAPHPSDSDVVSTRRGPRGYESIPRDLIQRADMSYKARGILSDLLSMPDGWEFHGIEGLAKRATEGRTAINSGVCELEDVGYLVRMRRRERNGRWSWLWIFDDTWHAVAALTADALEEGWSVYRESPHVPAGQDHNTKRAVDESPGRDHHTFPADGSPADGKPAPIEIYSGEIYSREELKNPLPPPPTSAAGSGHGSAVAVSEQTSLDVSTPDLFEAFWKVYPRKTGKEAARRAWKAAMRRRLSPREVIDAARAHAQAWAAAGTEQQFIPYPASWLNAGRYADAPDSLPTPATSGPRSGVGISMGGTTPTKREQKFLAIEQWKRQGQAQDDGLTEETRRALESGSGG